MRNNKISRIIFVILASVFCFSGNAQGQLRNETENSSDITTVSETAYTTESTSELFTDFQWFLEGIANFAEIVDHLLPDATANEAENRSSEFAISQYLLYGLKKLAVGTKDITKFALYAFGLEETRHSRQFSHTKLILSDIGKIIKSWFKSLRWTFDKFMELYNYYLTELLLGKCVGQYLIAAYPNRSFYEYPFLFIYEIFKTFILVQKENFIGSLITDEAVDTIAAEVGTTGQAQIVDTVNSHATEEISVEQNEIPDNESDKFQKHRSMRGRLFGGRALMNTTADALVIDKDESEFHTLQKCLKIYAAETMIGKIRKIFL